MVVRRMWYVATGVFIVLMTMGGAADAAVLGAADSAVPGAADAAVPEACGTAPSKADGSAWTCTFADDFDGSGLDRSIWMPTNHATGTSVASARACSVDDPSTVSVGDGALHLTVRESPSPVSCSGKAADYISGSVATYHTFSQQYGRFEARIKSTATTAPGLQESFWLWPDDRVPSRTWWPAAGEIDIVETYSQYYWLGVPFLHYTWYDNWGPIPGRNTAYCQALRGSYHTYTLTWTPEKLTIEIDGHTCLVNTSGDPAFKKPYIVSLNAALGVGSNALTAKTPIPATMDVDYVKAWR